MLIDKRCIVRFPTAGKGYTYFTGIILADRDGSFRVDLFTRRDGAYVFIDNGAALGVVRLLGKLGYKAETELL